jgi:hypothetical protein
MSPIALQLKMPLLGLALVALLASNLSYAEEQAAPSTKNAKLATSQVRAQEGDLLWSQAQADLELKRPESARARLERLIDRFPAHPRALEARPLLAKISLDSQQTTRAIAHLEFYVRAQPRRLNTQALKPFIDARLLLGDLYLAQNKTTRALGVSHELFSIQIPQAFSPDQELQAYLLQGEAFAVSNRAGEAKKALEKSTLVQGEFSQALLTRKQRLLTRLDLQVCEQLIQEKTLAPLDEGQKLALFERAGVCIQTALHPTEIRDPLLAPIYLRSLKNYRESCGKPRPPERLTAAEKKRYLAEFAPRLKQTCNERLAVFRELLDQPGLPHLQPLNQESRPL